MSESQESPLNIDEEDDTGSNILPYNFIRKHGVLVTQIENGVAEVFYKPGCKLSIFSELKRHLNCSLHLHKINIEDFEVKVSELYESGSSQAMQVMGDISGDMDLAHVAMGLGEPEDLLDESEDEPDEPEGLLDSDGGFDPDSTERAYTVICLLSRRLWRSQSATAPDLHLPLQ